MKEMSDQVRGILFVIAVAIDTFCLGTFLQAAGSSAANKFLASVRARGSVRIAAAAPRRRAPRCLRHAGAAKAAGPRGESCRGGSERRKNCGGAKPAVSRGTIESRRRGENLGAEEVYGRPEAAASAGFGERQRGAASWAGRFRWCWRTRSWRRRRIRDLYQD